MSGVHVTLVGIDTRLGATQEPPPKQVERVVVERIIERVIEKTKEKSEKSKSKHDKVKEKERGLEKRHTEPVKSTASGKHSKRKGSTSSVATFPPLKQERKLGHGEMLAVWFAGGSRYSSPSIPDLKTHEFR